MKQTTQQLEDRFDRWMLWFLPVFFTIMTAVIVIIVAGVTAGIIFGD